MKSSKLSYAIWIYASCFAILGCEDSYEELYANLVVSIKDDVKRYQDWPESSAYHRAVESLEVVKNVGRDELLHGVIFYAKYVDHSSQNGDYAYLSIDYVYAKKYPDFTHIAFYHEGEEVAKIETDSNLDLLKESTPSLSFNEYHHFHRDISPLASCDHKNNLQIALVKKNGKKTNFYSLFFIDCNKSRPGRSIIEAEGRKVWP
ncbi:MAG: hypothetical protein PHO37_17920 [Kiritimatiellae bacterium]|nr:hypothetical protein [Kiritimatiellia bacterium]